MAAPAAAAPLHFAAKGDWGDGSAAQARVSAAICAAHDARPFAFVLTTGDNFYLPDGVATADNWLRPEECIRRRGLRYVASWGNHDLGGDATRTVLGAAARQYTFREGPVRFVILDGNRPESVPARRRLIRALARRDSAATVVVVHQPLVTAGLHDGGPARWKRIIEAGGATLVLQGHNHLYERIHQRGVAYVTTGGGGAVITPCLRPRPGQAACRPRHHFTLITADERRLVIRARSDDGEDFDRVSVPVRGGADDPATIAAVGVF
jgi:hypothetical protein